MMSEESSAPDELSFEQVHGGESSPDELSFEQVHGQPASDKHAPGVKERIGSFMAGVGSAVPFGQDIPAAIGATLSSAGLMHGSKNIPEEGDWWDKFHAAKQAQIDINKQLGEAAPIEHGAGAVTGFAGTLPIGGPAAKAESAIAEKLAPAVGERIAKYGSSAMGGAGIGALYGLGEGNTAEERLQNMKSGALFGTVGGAAAPALVKGAEKVIGIPGEIYQGTKHFLGYGLEEEGAKRAGKQFEELQKLAKTSKTGLTPREAIISGKYGQEVLPIDVLGEPGIAAAKAASAVSPEAKGILEAPLRGRNLSQQDRARSFISEHIMGRPGENIYSNEVKEAIRKEASNYVPDAYKQAFLANEKGVWSPELENAVQYSTIQKSIPKAMEVVNDNRLREGLKPMESPFENIKGKWRIKEDSEVPLEIWDQIKREAQSAAEKHKPTPFNPGNISKYRQFSGAAADLTNLLKNNAPGYKEALEGAGKYLGEESAWNLGTKVAKTIDRKTINAIQGQIKKLNPTERGYLAHSYMQERMAAFDKMGEHRNIANIISPLQKEKDKIVLGAPKANMLHSYLHRENMMNKSLSGLGGSDTVNKFMGVMRDMLTGHGAATSIGSGVLADAYEVYKEAFDQHGHFSAPKLAKAFIFGAIAGKATSSIGGQTLRTGLAISNAQAKALAEMLVSKNPDDVRKALYQVHQNPALTQAISEADIAMQNFLAGESVRMKRASGGKIENRDYPAKRLTRVEKALKRAQDAIALESKPLMQKPDEQIAQALRIAKGE